MEFNVQTITYIIMLIIMVSITINEFTLNEVIKNKMILFFTWFLFFTACLSMYYAKGSGRASYIQLFVLGLFTVSAIGYTVYQWDMLSNNPDSECGYFLPHTDGFSSPDYYLYRIMYLSTIIILVSILQFKIDEKGFYVPKILENHLHKFVFLIPFILPILTETVNSMSNLLLGEKQNPESYLMNFIKGDSDKEWDGWAYARSAAPIMLYFILMILAILSNKNIIGTDGGTTAVYIIIFFLIFFSLIMRSIFIQDCSLEKNISKEETPCSLEKYGGLQSMFNVCLIIIIIYHIQNPTYKLLFFIIICLGSWALSTTYILNSKSD